MMGDLDLLLFAMVAAFLVLRLRNVLGKRTGHQQQKRDQISQQNQETPVEGNVVESPNSQLDQTQPEVATTPEEDTSDPIRKGDNQIKAADPTFDISEFSEGARGAFEMIVQAFAEGDKNALQLLLSEDVFENFRLAIDEREEHGETLETVMIGINSADVIEIGMNEHDAFVTISFVSEQINLTRDSEDRIIDGVPNQVTKITDIWTFSRDTRSSDPNWKLIETRSQN